MLGELYSFLAAADAYTIPLNRFPRFSLTYTFCTNYEWHSHSTGHCTSNLRATNAHGWISDYHMVRATQKTDFMLHISVVLASGFCDKQDTHYKEIWWKSTTREISLSQFSGFHWRTKHILSICKTPHTSGHRQTDFSPEWKMQRSHTFKWEWSGTTAGVPMQRALGDRRRDTWMSVPEHHGNPPNSCRDCYLAINRNGIVWVLCLTAQRIITVYLISKHFSVDWILSYNTEIFPQLSLMILFLLDYSLRIPDRSLHLAWKIPVQWERIVLRRMIVLVLQGPVLCIDLLMQHSLCLKCEFSSDLNQL